MPTTPRTAVPAKSGNPTRTKAAASPDTVQAPAKPRRRAPAAPAVKIPALPREERVRQLAYSYYEQRGGADGQALDDWLRAEQAIEADEVQAARSASDGH
jgi:hypothetical protein